MFKIIIVILIVLCVQVHSAKILCMFPMASFSHQIVFRAYTEELARQGHKLVIVTPDPYLPEDRPKDNITEIDVRFSYEFVKNLLTKATKIDKSIRGVAMITDDINVDTFSPLIDMYNQQLNYAPVKELLNNSKHNFDLLVIEALYDYPLIVSKILNVPTILISSFYGSAENYNVVGAVNRHPIYYPSYFRSDFSGSSLWERIMGVYREYKLYKLSMDMENLENKLLKSEYGPNAPSVRELRDNVHLLFLNSHPLYEFNRPVPPNVIHLGSLHLKPVKELPEDIQMDMDKYMDSSKNGVVYISFGTNTQPGLMDKDLLESMLIAIESLPYDVLWKFKGELEKKPENLKTFEWMPQRDLLSHPKIRLFVTQGGRQSLDEAIDAGVPMVGIPMIADQWYNINRGAELGICKQINVEDLTTENFLEAMLTVMNDKSFKENIRKLRIIINDQPQNSIERAVWWTEYVLRHGGTKHLRSPLANTSWSEYLMLDVVVTVAVTVITTLFILAFIGWHCISIIMKCNVRIDKEKKY